MDGGYIITRWVSYTYKQRHWVMREQRCLRASCTCCSCSVAWWWRTRRDRSCPPSSPAESPACAAAAGRSGRGRCPRRVSAGWAAPAASASAVQKLNKMYNLLASKQLHTGQCTFSGPVQHTGRARRRSCEKLARYTRYRQTELQTGRITETDL